jgi:CHAT domain-containing protein/Tfp pilus assembly protein PilF
MNTYLRILLFVGFGLSFSTPIFSQKQELLDKLVKASAKAGGDNKAKLDAMDFLFAISVNENASIMDVQQKGEAFSNALYALKEESDKTSVERARDTLEMAINYYESRWYKMAELTFMQAKRMIERDGLQENINYLRAISAIGVVHLSQGRTMEANQYIAEALDKSFAQVGEKSAAYVSNLNNQAKLNQTLGQYTEAENQFDAALRLGKEVFVDNTKPIAIILNNKAMFLQTMGRYEEAIGLMQEAIVLADKAPKKGLEGKKSFDSRRFQANLAVLYQLNNQLTLAESTYESIRKVFENRKQTSNPEYASLLNQLSLLHIQMGKTTSVEANLKKALDIYKKKISEESPAYAKALNDLGEFYRQQSKFAEAEKSLTRAAEIRASILGTDHPDYNQVKENLGILYWKMGQYDKAYDAFKIAMDASIHFINRYFPSLSEAEKAKYWDVLQPRFQRFYNFCIDAHATTPGLLVDMVEYHMATKALLLNATNRIKQTILASKDPALIQDYIAWLDKRENLARLYSYSKQELIEQNIDLKLLEEEANQLERSLSLRSVDFSKGYTTERINFKQIVNVLTPQEAVVDIVRIRKFDQAFTDDVVYAVIILTKQSSTPSLVVLENGKLLETRYAKYYHNVIQQRMEDTHSYTQFFEKFSKALDGKKVVYFSLDGVFNQINLNTLKSGSGKYVLNHYDIVLLGNTKDLVSIKARKPSSGKKTATLVGFPTYGSPDIAPLPGTKVEVEGVSKILKTGAFQVNSMLGAQATEAGLKKVKSPTLLHIATHGYFLQDVEQVNNAYGVDVDNAGRNPLLRSGLMLTGAGAEIDNQLSVTSNDNGIMTAYEAMNLDLYGTDLVVMSACETGLGEIRNGEGVYGLQRAFLVAGANALIMSLWKVDDAATQQLMNNFYTQWLKSGNKQSAFKQAQTQLMTKYPDPYYWGAFVMIGL